MFAQIITTDIERELRRRGLYTEAPFVTPAPPPIFTPEITPLIPEAPTTPVVVTPGPPPIYREPVYPPYVPPYVTPYLPEVTPEITPGLPPIEEPDRELWLPGGPPTRKPEAKISKTAIIAGGVILAAVILFTQTGAAPGKRKPTPRRRTREDFRPDMEAVQ